MGFRLREIDVESKFCLEFSLDAIDQVVSISQVQAVLSDVGVSEQRERKLNMVVTVFIVIGMGLYNHLSIGKVLKQLVKGLRYIWPDPNYLVAKDSAISYRRNQLGARPLAELFRRICRPLATEDTPGPSCLDFVSWPLMGPQKTWLIRLKMQLCLAAIGQDEGRAPFHKCAVST